MTGKRAAVIRKRLDLLVVCMALASLAHPFFQTVAANPDRGPGQAPLNKLRKADRERLIAAKLRGQNHVMLMMATQPGMNAAAVRAITALGAVIRFREDAVDYVRARVPIDRVAEIARLDSVGVMAIDGLQFYYTSQDLPVSQSRKSPPPDAVTPAENPYLPAADIGAPQFIREHPTFDGRGVTIANVDGNSPDILAPELQKAFSIDGTPVPKFSDVINGFDPVDDETPLRVDMSNEVEARNGLFEWKQVTYHSPVDGKFRFGFFNIDGFAGGLLRNYLPKLTPQKDSLTILWQEHNNLVWVDTDLNQNFADETALTDFNSSYLPGVLGKDNPATPLRETVAFTILINQPHKLIYLAPLANGHATATASVLAGHNFFGGQMNGVAPGARIASALRKSLTHSFIETMILMIKNPKVDLVSLQWAARIPPMDGSSVLGVIFQRLVDKYKKPIFASADNSGPGINTNGEPAAAEKVISVGGYVSSSTWQSNFGVFNASKDTIINLSARGPRADGAFKPDLIAPAAGVTADFAIYEPRVPPPFVLPPGYSSAAGTSNSAPMAAGAAALLISAAKQSGVPYDGERIAWALKSSARYLPGIGAQEQGNGLINVAAAWEALKRAPAPVAIASSVKINVAIGPYLRTPNHGPGIFEREGWQAGQSGRRTITFIRSSGSSDAVDYVVRWTGNDGSFSSGTKIRLPLNQTVSFPVTIAVKTAGIHSAILNLDDPSTGARSVYQLMNTVIAAEQFNTKENFTVTREGSAEYPAYASYFFNVPENTSAFKVDLKISHGTVRLRFMRPTGKEFDHAHDTPVRWQPEYQRGGAIDRVIVDPEPGVWQVIVENQDLVTPGDSETRRASFLLTARIFGAESKSPTTEPTRVRGAINKQVRFASHFAPFDAYYGESPLGSAFSSRLTVAATDESLIYDIDIPPGASKLQAHIAGPATKPGDVDLYLYFCAKECELKAFSTRAGAQEQVTIAQPKSGKWKVVIDPVSIPSGLVSLDYTDVFTHAAFGSLIPLNAGIPKGSKGDIEFAARVNALPLNGRRLVGVAELMTQELVTLRYEYNAATKMIEPVKERATLAETLLELHGGITKPKLLSDRTDR